VKETLFFLHCIDWYVSDFDGKFTDNEDIISSWSEDTPDNRAQAVVKANLDYMNWALANSEIPIRYVQWGSVQDIGKTDAEIGSGCQIPGFRCATRTADEVKERYE
jgi:hypothetical protein